MKNKKKKKQIRRK